MPGLVLFCFKRPKVQIHLHPEPAFEVFRHPPRVPAKTASTILATAGGEYISRFIKNFQLG